MNFKTLILRFRGQIILLLYLLGFFAPWEYLLSRSRPSTLWLAASTLLARTGWMELSVSTALVTVAALCCCFLGAILRVWGTAYVGAFPRLDSNTRGAQLVAAGPYRHFRNPLYLGNCLFATGVAVLMPPSGAVFFLATFYLLHLALIFAEEDFLAVRGGESYREYRRQVPRLWPSLAPEIASSGTRPDWLRALPAEIYFVGFAFCFAAFAWRYSAMILIKCLIIWFGFSLITRGLLLPALRATKGEVA